MNVKVKFVIFNEIENKFVKNDEEFTFELDEELENQYKTLKKSDKNIYNFFKNSQLFLKWIKEELFVDGNVKKVGISAIGDVSFLRFWFFKIESSQAHYDYFTNYFDIYVDVLFESRDSIGENILSHLKQESPKMIIDLEQIVLEDETTKEII